MEGGGGNTFEEKESCMMNWDGDGALKGDALVTLFNIVNNTLDDTVCTILVGENV